MVLQMKVSCRTAKTALSPVAVSHTVTSADAQFEL